MKRERSQEKTEKQTLEEIGSEVGVGEERDPCHLFLPSFGRENCWSGKKHEEAKRRKAKSRSNKRSTVHSQRETKTEERLSERTTDSVVESSA